MPRQFIVALIGTLVGLIVAGLPLAGPAKAGEPTPAPETSPPDQAADLFCALSMALSRASLNPPSLAADSSKPSLIFANPAVGARDVPTYTLVSAVFDRPVDPGTLTEDTFYLSQPTGRVGGSISYIEPSNTAVFRPERPLAPRTVYTATVTAGVRSLAGDYLTRPIAWSFVTFDGSLEASGTVAAARVSPYGDGMYVYFGDLHSHSGYSDGQDTPAEAFATARANGLDFFGLTDHDIFLSNAEWQDTLIQANAATVEGQFIALRGFEFTHSRGHLNVFNTNTFVRGNNPGYSQLVNFYGWLVNQPGAIAQFNHPYENEFEDLDFNNFAYHVTADYPITLRELTNEPEFLLSMNKGWHLGSLRGTDTHKADWGRCRLTGLVAPSLTTANILGGLKAKRTFFVSPFDANLAVLLKANGYWMGSAIPYSGQINFNIKVYDPNPYGSPLKLILYDNGVKVAETLLPATTLYSWTPRIMPALGHYYYVEAYYPGWIFSAYSSPVWVERLPVAEAGPAQMVIPGDLVSLDGSQSYDPDGDPLLYQWAEQSGPGVTLSGAGTAQPTFVAPWVAGDIVFKLRVEDTGGLAATDLTVVTVNTKPILTISKSGPETAEPGEPISYILTVTNSGATTATGVVITDAVPAGATYVSGGTPSLDYSVVSWMAPELAAYGGVAQVSFTVTTTGGLANKDYRVSCAEGVSAAGTRVILTNAAKAYLPAILKQAGF